MVDGPAVVVVAVSFVVVDVDLIVVVVLGLSGTATGASSPGAVVVALLGLVVEVVELPFAFRFATGGAALVVPAAVVSVLPLGATGAGSSAGGVVVAVVTGSWLPIATPEDSDEPLKAKANPPLNRTTPTRIGTTFFNWWLLSLGAGRWRGAELDPHDEASTTGCQ